MRTIKCGVIGLGWFGEKHCEVLHDLPQAELYTVCTRRPDRLKQVADRFGTAASYTDYHELLADPPVEVVSVVTMWDQHVEPAVAALEAGKHVFLEKPMASTVADCDRIVAAAAKAGQAGSYARWRSRASGLPEFGGELPVSALAEEIETPGSGQIHALIVSAGNPVLSIANGPRLELDAAQVARNAPLRRAEDQRSRVGPLLLLFVPPEPEPDAVAQRPDRLALAGQEVPALAGT